MSGGTYTSDTYTYLSLNPVFSPATITATGGVTAATGNAVYGAPRHGFTLVNRGHIAADEGSGVVFADRGAVTNAAGGTISGFAAAIAIDVAGAVVNAGDLQGTHVGVFLSFDGALTNQSGGTIQGFDGVGMARGSATLANAGLIEGNGVGVLLLGTGAQYVGNTGTITGGAVGIDIATAAGSIENTGLIEAFGRPNADGISLGMGGHVVNGGTIEASDYGILLDRPAGSSASAGTITNDGTILGSVGIAIRSEGATATVVNAGTIDGTGGIAVQLDGGTLIAAAGADFVGSVDGVGGTNTLELLGGSAIGTIDGIGGFQTVAFTAGARWLFEGADTIAHGLAVGSGSTIIADGTITDGGIGTDATDFTGPGLLLVESAARFQGDVVGGGGTLELGAADGPGILGGLGTSFAGFALYQVDSGGQWTLSGSNAVATGRTLADAGQMRVASSLGNQGIIEGAGTLAVEAGAVLTNGAAGENQALIAGVALLSAGTVDNFGTIHGGIDAVILQSADALVVAEAGSDFVGLVLGDGGTLALAGGSGTIAGLGSTASLTGSVSGRFTGFDAYAIAAGGTWKLEGAATLAAGQTLSDAGRLAIDGTLDLAGGVLFDSGSLTDAGVIAIGAGGTLDLLSAVGAGTVDFLGFGAVLALGVTSGVSLALSGFGLGDRIDLAGVSYDAGHMNATYGGGELEIFDRGIAVAALHLTGLPVGSLPVQSDGHGGIVIDTIPALYNGGARGAIYLPTGGLVQNGGPANPTASVDGGSYGIKIAGGTGAVTNFGTIEGSAAASYGVDLAAGGTITNYASGTIVAGTGILAGPASGTTVDNFGLIEGVDLVGPAALLLNQAGAIITGGVTLGYSTPFGIGSTLVDAGTIDGGVLMLTELDVLVIATGAMISGLIEGEFNTLALEGSGGTLQVPGAGRYGLMSGSAYGRFEGFRDYIIESGANWTLAGNDRLDDGRTLTNDGILTVSGDLYLTGRDGGGILVNSGQLIDTGLIQIGYDGTLDLASGTASGALEFLGPGGVLELAARSDVSLTVSGFGAGDQIDLPGIRYDAGQMSASYGSGLLTVFDRGTAVASFNVTGLPPGALPVIADAQGGTAIETLTTIYNGGASGQINKYTGCVVINGGSSDTTASIEAADFAIRIEGGLGAVENFGTLDGTAFQNQGYGVIIGNGGSVYNAASGTILGVSAGIDASVSDPLTVVNLGLVDASSGAGVELGDGGLVVNHTGGQITGAQRGVWSYGTGAPTTVINYGTISGGTDAIEFKLSTDLLIAKPGSDFVGLIVGGGGALKLSGGSGTITGLGATGTLSGTESGTFTGFGSYSVGVGGAWMLAGSDALATGQTLTDNGRVTVAGTLDLAGGVLVANGALVDGGTIEIGTGGTLDLGSPISSGLVDFTASGGVLELGQTSGVSLAIAGFVIGDQIDLSGVAYDAGHMRATYADGNLVVYDGAVERADLHLTGLPAGSFAVASDGHGGIDIGGVPTLVTIRSSGIAAFTPDVAGETVTLGVASGGVALSGDVSAVLVGHETQAGTTEFLAGNAGNDTICGAGGSGTIRSGSGANLIRTGGGSMVVVSQGRDTIRVGAGTVRIDATASATVFGGSGMTEVTDDGTTAGADKVHAGSGTTVMTSGLGRDSFIGGSGTAFMTDDGHGRVTFQFEKGLNGTDIVSGFDRATDSIRVVPGSVSWGDVLGRQTVAGGNTFIDTADGTRIEFVGVAGLTAADFKI